MNHNELIPHLFRTEFSRITSVLAKHFGIAHIETAEDIASETFVSALENWTYKGVPENPTAWLYAVAKNKARNYLSRTQAFTEKVIPQLAISENVQPEIDLSEKNIFDSQLQMLFAICHPAIPAEAQIGLALRVLCGFGIEEIANAFVTSKDTINKRLFRAKEKLRHQEIAIEFPAEDEISNRLEAVLTTLYLLFNEGYYSESHDAVLREDLCAEAMRLTALLLENEKTNRPVVNALYAIMCFHASRFPARKNNRDQLVLYEDQNEALWNYDLIAKGAYHLHQASREKSISKYHLEAGIAYWHTQKADTKEKWETILQLYNRLLQLEYSPVAALNRTFALSKANGKLEALAEAQKLQLNNNHYYHTLLGTLFKDLDNEKAKQHFEKAYALAKTKADKLTILKRIHELI